MGQSLGGIKNINMILGMTSFYIALKGFPGLRGTILIAPAIKDNGD